MIKNDVLIHVSKLRLLLFLIEFDELQEIDIVDSEESGKIVAYVPKGKSLGVLGFLGVPSKVRK